MSLTSAECPVCLDADGKHAILSTAAFPKGVKDMAIKDGVILARPTQVVGLVDLLRRTMIQNHVLGLSQANEGRKKDKLYELINSDSYRQSHQLQERILRELQEIDVEESAAHKKIWERRGAKHRKLEKLVLEANESIAAIVELEELAEVPQSTEGRSSAAVQDHRPIRTGLQH